MVLRINKLLSLFLTVSICIACFVGCQDNSKNDAKNEEPKNAVEAKYETLPYENYVIRADYWYDEIEGKLNHVNLQFGDSDLILLSTFDEYKAANIYDLERSEEFFEENALLAMKYTHSSSDEPIELVDIAIKDGKLYPVISMELPPNHNICADIKDTYIVADVKKSDVKKYAFGEVLAINLANENDGSVYHEKFE